MYLLLYHHIWTDHAIYFYVTVLALRVTKRMPKWEDWPSICADREFYYVGDYHRLWEI